MYLRLPSLEGLLMRAKYKVYLTDNVYAVLSLDLSIPKDQQQMAAVTGMSEQEQSNAVGQKLQELLYLLGNTDEA
jgi:hypothetical protein